MVAASPSVCTTCVNASKPLTSNCITVLRTLNEMPVQGAEVNRHTHVIAKFLLSAAAEQTISLAASLEAGNSLGTIEHGAGAFHCP
jgi:hypothetical protein